MGEEWCHPFFPLKTKQNNQTKNKTKQEIYRQRVHKKCGNPHSPRHPFLLLKYPWICLAPNIPSNIETRVLPAKIMEGAKGDVRPSSSYTLKPQWNGEGRGSGMGEHLRILRACI